LVDILKALDIEPDGMIGHSVGELGCAYADGCFTAEEMIMAAYARGRASVDTKLPDGMMAAIGVGYQSIKNRLPSDIDVACHNSKESCTISGPTASVKKFVEKLKSEKVFAKMVNVSNISFHSRYIQPAAPTLLEYLSKVRFKRDGFRVFIETIFNGFSDFTESETEIVAMAQYFCTRVEVEYGFGSLLFRGISY
jgi:acyl transferase domain-containing protein